MTNLSYSDILNISPKLLNVSSVSVAEECISKCACLSEFSYVGKLQGIAIFLGFFIVLTVIIFFIRWYFIYTKAK